MTYRDANANPMLDMLDLHKPAFLCPPTLAPPLLKTDPTRLRATRRALAPSPHPARSRRRPLVKHPQR